MAELLAAGIAAPEFRLPVTPDQSLGAPTFFINGARRHDATFEFPVLAAAIDQALELIDKLRYVSRKASQPVSRISDCYPDSSR
jgi:hypothetical protein